MSQRFERHVRWLELSVQRGTDEVPDDGRYHLVQAGVVTYSTSSEAIALARLELAQEEAEAANPHLVSPRELLRRESAFGDIMAVKGAAKDRRTAGEQAKGGKGGRSGV